MITQDIVKLQFPTMLRKMWSGSEVQAWIDENYLSQPNEPVAILHDDGHYTFMEKVKAKYYQTPAGWKLTVYEAQPNLEQANKLLRIKELEIECATLDSCAKFNAEKILELSTKLDELTKFHSSADKLAEKQAECVDKMGRLTSKCKLMMDALNEVNLYINNRHTLQHHINIHDILRDVLEIKLDDE